MHRDFPGLGAEHESLHPDEIADVEQLLEDSVVKLLVLARTDFVAVDVDLDSAIGVLQLHERGFAHDAATHHTAGNHYLGRLPERIPVRVGLRVTEIGLDFVSMGIDRELRCGIWVNPHGTHLVERPTAYNLLLAQFENIHRIYSFNINI